MPNPAKSFLILIPTQESIVFYRRFPAELILNNFEATHLFMTKFLRNTLLGLLLFFTVFQAHAQDTTATGTIDTSYKFPKAILVQLRSEHNRLAALTEARRYKETEMVMADAANIREKMIADFKDHVTFCPVYYYIDTNVDLVKKGKFEGVLFNADNTPAVNTAFNDTSNDYLIVYYGYPDYQSRVTDSLTTNPRNTNLNTGDHILDRANTNYLSETYGYPVHPTNMRDSVNNKDDIGYGEREPFGRGLVINNNRFQQVSYIYKLDYENIFFRIKKGNRKYIYVSKHFDMEYFPFAVELNSKLVTVDLRRRKIRISHYPGLDLLIELFR